MEENHLAWLVAEATRLHKEAHDAAPPGGCMRCRSREIRAAIKEARENLTPEAFQILKWSLTVEMG